MRRARAASGLRTERLLESLQLVRSKQLIEFWRDRREAVSLALHKSAYDQKRILDGPMLG